MRIAAPLALASLLLLVAGDASVRASAVRPSLGATEGIALLAVAAALILLVRFLPARWFPKSADHALIVLPVLVVGGLAAYQAVFPTGAVAQTSDAPYLWLSQLDSDGNSVAVSPSEEVFVAGSIGLAVGDADVLLTKYGSDGTKVWTRQFGRPGNTVSYDGIDNVGDVAVDSDGNAYVVGDIQGSLDNQPHAGGRDAYVVKYAPDGTKLWTRQFGTSQHEYGNGVALDPSSGDIYMSGYTQVGLFEGETRYGAYDGFLARYRPDGTRVWIRQFGTANYDYSFKVGVDAGGNTYLAGRLEGGTTTAGPTDIQVLKFAPNGTQIWRRQFGSSGSETVEDIAVDSSGNTYVGGDTDGALQGNTSAGGRDAFLARYSPDGAQAWVRQFGSTDIDNVYGVATSSGGAPYVAGTTYGVLGNSSAGTNDVFVRRYSPDGTPGVTRQLGSSGQDDATGVAVGPGGHPYVVGSFNTGCWSGAACYSFLAKFPPNLDPPPAPEPDSDRSDDFGLSDNGNPSDAGDPVNVTTGNVYDVQEDLNIPGRGLPLRFVRSYNSQDTINRSLGYGWTHSYNASLTENGDGSVTELAPDGKRLTFTKNADGSYAAPKGVFDTLTKNADGTYTLRKKDGIEWRFSADGRLASITDPNSNSLSFSYDASARLQKITDSAGRDTLLTYDGSDRIETITDPAGRVVRYGYLPTGDLASVTDPAGNVTRYEYDADHNLKKTTNPGDPFGSGNSGDSITFGYDAQDRAISTEASGGNYKMTLDYRPAENKTLVTDSKGNTSEFYYDSDEQVTRIVDPYGKAISYTWYPNGNKKSETDQLGNTTTYEYDPTGNLTKVIEPKPTAAATQNPTTTLTYQSAFNRLKSVTDPEGGLTSYDYDARGNLIRATDAGNNVTTFDYDQYGQLKKTVDPRGNATATNASDGTTTFTYDNYGNLSTVTDAQENASSATNKKMTTLTYGAATSLESVLGVPASITDPLGRTTNFSYNPLGDLTRVTNPLTPPDTARTTVNMAYDAMGNRASVTNENGHTTSYDYNHLGWLEKVTHPDPNPADTIPAPTSTYTYDTEGNLRTETNPAGNTATYDYDKLTRLTRVTIPDGTTNPDGTQGMVETSYTYDDAGRLATETDPRGYVTRYSHDNLGRLTKVTDLKGDGTTAAEATYDYDLTGDMTRATNPNSHATTYTYDKLSQLRTESDPLGNTFTYDYDENGNVKTRTDALGRATNYTYDQLNRLRVTGYPNGTSVQTDYDPVGNLLSATDETETYSFAYDERDRLLTETFPGGQTLRHAYDPAGNRTSLAYPDGKKTLYSYDAADRLSSVTDYQGARTTYSYDALDLPTAVAYPNGVGETFAYDPLGRATRATITGTNSTGGTYPMRRLTYAYDKSSNPTSITDKAGQTSTFKYDELNRLTQEAHPEQTLSYAYDAAGNRTSMTQGTATTSYTYNAAERMTKAGTTTFTYNKVGETTSRTTGTTTTNYAYDYEGMMTKAGTRTYARDPFGRAVSSTAGTTTTEYLFDGAEAIQEKSGTTTTYYTRGLGGQLVNRRAGTGMLRYYHHDAIGSVVGLSDTAGDLTDTYSYTAFGNQRTRTGTDAQPYQYLENAYDSSSKLYDFHARTYDPGVGRFTSKDPVRGYAELPQTLNPYAYGRDNPLVYTDPYGRDTVGGCLTGSAGGLGGIVGGFFERCIVTDGNTVKRSRTLGGPVQTPTVSVGAGGTYSDAESVDSLGGFSTYGGGGASAETIGVSGTLSTANDAVSANPFDNYKAYDVMVGANPTSIAFPILEVHGGGSYTAVDDILIVTPVAEYLLPRLREYYLNSRAEKK